MRKSRTKSGRKRQNNIPNLINLNINSQSSSPPSNTPEIRRKPRRNRDGARTILRLASLISEIQLGQSTLNNNRSNIPVNITNNPDSLCKSRSMQLLHSNTSITNAKYDISKPQKNQLHSGASNTLRGAQKSFSIPSKEGPKSKTQRIHKPKLASQFFKILSTPFTPKVHVNTKQAQTTLTRTQLRHT